MDPMIQWLFLVDLIGGRWYIITQLAVYTTYIPLIYCRLETHILNHLFPMIQLRHSRSDATWTSLADATWRGGECHSHSIHVWYSFLHLHKNQPNVGKSYMDCTLLVMYYWCFRIPAVTSWGLVVYPIIYSCFSYIPGGWPWDFWTINRYVIGIGPNVSCCWPKDLDPQRKNHNVQVWIQNSTVLCMVFQ